MLHTRLTEHVMNCFALNRLTKRHMTFFREQIELPVAPKMFFCFKKKSSLLINIAIDSSLTNQLARPRYWAVIITRPFSSEKV